MDQWVIEVESGINWSTVCRCGSEGEAERRARYFRPMSCFSGRELRIRPVAEPTSYPNDPDLDWY